MNVPTGIKHAVHMGTNEVFLEWLDLTADDPEGALESLGASYQDVLTPDMVPEADAPQLIADLAAWDDGSVDPSHEARVRRLHTLICTAGIDFARGLIAHATGTDATPERVAPYMAELEPLVTELKRALAAGTFDDSTFDIQAAIWD